MSSISTITTTQPLLDIISKRVSELRPEEFNSCTILNLTHRLGLIIKDLERIYSLYREIEQFNEEQSRINNITDEFNKLINLNNKK